MKPIKELSEQIRLLTEETTPGQKKFYIEGIYLQGDIGNKNKRFYPSSILRNEVARYVRESVEKNSAWGELGHPSTPSINAERICHRIVSLKESGSNIIGRALVTNTPYGNIIKGLMEDGGRIGVSSRGLGSVVQKGDLQEVQSDFYLAAVDAVIDPSAPDAFVQGIMEDKEYIWQNGFLVEANIATMKKSILKAPMSQLEKVKLGLFEQFLNSLNEAHYAVYKDHIDGKVKLSTHPATKDGKSAAESHFDRLVKAHQDKHGKYAPHYYSIVKRPGRGNG